VRHEKTKVAPASLSAPTTEKADGQTANTRVVTRKYPAHRRATGANGRMSKGLRTDLAQKLFRGGEWIKISPESYHSTLKLLRWDKREQRCSGMLVHHSSLFLSNIAYPSCV